MDVLQDEVVTDQLDLLLHEASPRVEAILSRLHQLGCNPHGDTSTTIFAQALFVDNYTYIRSTDEISVPDALAVAYGQALKHPVMTNWLSKKGVQMLDEKVGGSNES